MKRVVFDRVSSLTMGARVTRWSADMASGNVHTAKPMMIRGGTRVSEYERPEHERWSGDPLAGGAPRGALVCCG